MPNVRNANKPSKKKLTDIFSPTHWVHQDCERTTQKTNPNKQPTVRRRIHKRPTTRVFKIGTNQPAHGTITNIKTSTDIKETLMLALSAMIIIIQNAWYLQNIILKLPRTQIKAFSTTPTNQSIQNRCFSPKRSSTLTKKNIEITKFLHLQKQSHNNRRHQLLRYKNLKTPQIRPPRTQDSN